MKKLEDLILTYKDFPKKGIDFKDVLEILVIAYFGLVLWEH